MVMSLILRSVILGTLCAAVIWGCRPSATESDELDAEGKPLNLLCAAAKRGDASKVRSLLTAGANPNATDARGGTALQYAASSGKIAVVQLLLAAGANVRAQDHDGSTALHAAAVDRELPIVELLLA